MYLEEYLKQFDNKNVKLFVDMDGVIVDYEVGNVSRYDFKRPLLSNLEKLEKISKKDNIELYILSISKTDLGVKEKYFWLDKYAPFFKHEKRIIISKENGDGTSSKKLKSDYLKTVEGDVIILIDDDPSILKEVMNNNKNVYLLKDTALID